MAKVPLIHKCRYPGYPHIQTGILLRYEEDEKSVYYKCSKCTAIIKYPKPKEPKHDCS